VKAKTFYIEPEFDFKLITIVSSLKDYRTCWLLNNTLKISFLRMPELEVPLTKKNKTAFFNLFEYYDHLDKMKYNLISNKDNGDMLLPELKTIDYIIKLEGDLDTAELKQEEWIATLKTIPFIEAVFAAEPEELKSRNNLIF